MRLHRTALATLILVQAAGAFHVAPVQNRNVARSFSAGTSPSDTSATALYGKLWDKLQIEPDTMEDEPGWYVMNCVAGSEKDLLAQAKHVTRDISTDLIEKITVPTERALRSHGKKQKVVEVRVLYPGYCFVKMRCCAETYEPLQELPLCRSWMAGTVNQKGYKKLPPAPICLSDEEVSKFKGLEEATDKMYEKFGEDYTGRGDNGEDLIAQYEGYEVDNMVKILSGNFKGEDGVVKRLKDGQIMVRLFTYGNINDQWFKTEEIRPMTDAEAMKGLTGPAAPVNQDEFDVSIGKKPKRRENDRRYLNDRAGGGRGGAGQRNRRQDRIARGERGNNDVFGRSDQEIAKEEENWRLFREEQRAEQQQKRGDMWGIKERTSWDAGDDAATMDADGKWKSGRQMRKDTNRKATQDLADAVSGDGDGGWDLFSSDAQESGGEDDFFNSLMTELSDDLDSDSSTRGKSGGGSSVDESNKASDDDDFFASLMSELSDSADSNAGMDEKHNQAKSSKSRESPSNSFQEDDFFASLEADLSESLNSSENENDSGNSDESDFFASLESDLSNSLKDSSGDSEESFFSDLETEISKGNADDGEQDFFASLEEDLSSELNSSSMKETSESETTRHDQGSNRGGGQDLNKLKVADLKVMLKERGLKVSGKKSDLIQRLQES